MVLPLLKTKFFSPQVRREVVARPRLVERLNAGVRERSGGFARKLTLVSAAAGFGKTTLLSEWIGQLDYPVAWLSLDENDNDPVRFLTYLIAALQTIEAEDESATTIGTGALGALQSPQPPPAEAILTGLINDVATLPKSIILVLDDYHLIDVQPIHDALAFLLKHLPPQMHLVIATREDPPLPLARLRARGQLTELRAGDLRFTRSETTTFLNQVMDLDLSEENLAALEKRTEGWIAGLHLAAVSMQGREDVTGFIESFTGSHHFVLDYLLEEVLQQQSEPIQAFLLETSILERLCGPLCDTVRSGDVEAQGNSQTILEELHHANLFLVPLDEERRWYRYHHLFGELLRQRLLQSHEGVAGLHRRASVWYEEQGLELEAFRHAVAGNDVDRAARLVEGAGTQGRPRMPLQFRGAVVPVLNWLSSLPPTVLDARPALWVMHASALSMTGQLSGVEEKLQAAEAALKGAEPDAEVRNLIGHIAAIRALLAAAQNQVEASIAQSHRALEYLHPDNLAVRTATVWKMGIAYHLQGDRGAAREAYAEAVAISEASGNTIINIAAATGLGSIQEAQNQLHEAAATYRRILQMDGEPQSPSAADAYLGMARVLYEWNDLDGAQDYGRQGIELARQIQNTERFIPYQIFIARLNRAQANVTGAAAALTEARQLVQRHSVYGIDGIVAEEVITLLRQGNLAAAAQLVEEHDLPLSQARVKLALGEPAAALAVIEPWRHEVEAKYWQDELLKLKILEAVALHAQGKKNRALSLFGEVLAMAAPGGFVRTFVDEGPPIARLLSEAADQGLMPDYVGRLLAAFQTEDIPYPPPIQPLIEPLSSRELEVLELLAQGLSNREIGERLSIALSTVKGHNRNIYGKLGVQRRTAAVARARELGLL